MPRRAQPEKDREALIGELRASLEKARDPGVREALLRALAHLEGEGREASPAPVRRWVVQALEAAGLTGEPRELDLPENARVVLEKRYLLRDREGNLIEDPAGMFRRVARAIAEADRLYDPQADIEAVAEEFYRVMARLEFLPNSPTLMNAGTGAGTLSACFVLGLEDSMDGIMETAKQAALVQKFGGGTGFALTSIRPKGSPISTTHGRACGPVAVLRHLSSVSTLVTQGGKRDGANMAVMDVHHPDILEFITCKRQEGEVHNFNISVGADDAFMQAVERGEDYDLIDPRDGRAVRRLNAREVFDLIVEGAWLNGEPGLVFLDRINRDNPTPHVGRITATNPCGEQPLLPYESCNLGSINLARCLRYTPEGAEIDWEKLRRLVWTAVHFLDNVIDANRYSVPEIERMTKLTRKIGLGVMGFADMLVRLGVPYDSEEGLETARRIMRFIREEADRASVALAEVRGVFPAWKGSVYDPGANPDPSDPRRGMRVRNACRLTVAPTGTISMIAGCSSGIEPLFALAYRKQNILEGQTLYYIDKAFEAVARHQGFYSDALMEALSQGEPLRAQEGVPAWVKRLFVTSPDIAPEWHVRMQAAFQESTDAAISKTINFPHEATVEEVRTAYLLAWKLGCKGITVYRAGSRQKEVLTAGTAPSAPAERPGGMVPRQRPTVVQGVTERLRTGHGTMYITTNFDEGGRPFEVFTTLGKAGGCDSAYLEGIARLVSLALRAGVDPGEVVEQLRGITCCPVWEGGVLIKSPADAVGLALARALGWERGEPYATQPALIDREEVKGGEKRSIIPVAFPRREQAPPQGDGRAGWTACPKCSGPLVYQEGCLTCRECGYSRCA